jgi:integrase/recombinase XerD
MTIGEAIERYRSQLELLNYSPATIAAYCRSLERFGAFLTESGAGRAEAGDLAAVTSQQIHNYQRDIFYRPTIHGTTRSPKTQNQLLVAVKNLFAFLREEGFITRDPTAELHYAREPQTLPRNILTPQEARRVIEAADIQTVIGFRDRTLLEVLYATGIRKGELLALTAGNVNLEEELLRINHGKGAKDRVAPLSSVACRFLETYLNAIRPRLLRNRATDRLFLSSQARPLGRTTLDAIISKYAKLARIGKRVTCHVWRHTCATHLLQNKANLRHVQEILGHRSLATTERYLRVTITELKEAHRKFHPREKSSKAPR